MAGPDLSPAPSSTPPFQMASPKRNEADEQPFFSFPQFLSFSLILVLAPFIQNEKYTFADASLEIVQLQEIT